MQTKNDSKGMSMSRGVNSKLMPGGLGPKPGRSFERYQQKGGDMNRGAFNASGGAGAAAKAKSKAPPTGGFKSSGGQIGATVGATGYGSMSGNLAGVMKGKSMIGSQSGFSKSKAAPRRGVSPSETPAAPPHFPNAPIPFGGSKLRPKTRTR